MWFFLFFNEKIKSSLSMNWTDMHKNVGKTGITRKYAIGKIALCCYLPMACAAIDWLIGQMGRLLLWYSQVRCYSFMGENKLSWGYLCTCQTALSYVTKCMHNCIVTLDHQMYVWWPNHVLYLYVSYLHLKMKRSFKQSLKLLNNHT